MFRQIAAVCLVVGLALLAAYWSRKPKSGRFFGYQIGSGGSRRLVLVERMAAGPQHWLCIVRVDDREILLGLHAGGMTVLDGRMTDKGAEI